MEDTVGKGPEKRVPMRAQADNQPPHLKGKRERWRQGLREALARVSPEAEAMVDRRAKLHTMDTEEEELYNKVGVLVRNGRVIEFSGYRHVQGQHKYYEESANRPASALESALWTQAVAAQGIQDAADVLTGEQLADLQNRVNDLWRTAFPHRTDPTQPPLVTGEEFSRE